MAVRLGNAGRVFAALGAVAAAGVVAAGAGAQTATPARAAASVPDTAAAVVDTTAAARGRAALVGRVRTASGEAIPDVELTVLGDGSGQHSGDGRSARTGTGGAFRVDSVRPGRYFVRVRRLGYEPLYFSATLDGGQARRIDVELTPLPAQLSGVDVRGKSGFTGFAERRLADFDRRRRMGFGRFYTRDDLKPYAGRLLSDALPYLSFGASARDLDLFSPFPTSTYATAAGCGGYAGYAGRAGYGYGYGSGSWRGPDGGFRCGVRVSLNGALPVPGDVAADYPVSQIEALEVYGRTLVVWTGTESDD